MKIVLAIDSFKGSLTSAEAEQAVAEAILQHHENCTTDCIPIADGGEGTLSVLMNHMHGTPQAILAHDPCMRTIPTTYSISTDGQTAFIEMASVSGLPLLSEEERNPMHTTTYGTGELIRDALDKGCTRLIVGIGGSATNDAGIGMLQALGYRFLDNKGNELGTGGRILEKIALIDDTRRHPSLKNVHFIVICDVQNPFYGPEGAAHVYARQKGADNEMIEALDKGMQSFARIIQNTTGKDIAHLPGSGSAGGLGGSLHAFLDADLRPGADLLLELCRFAERITDADLVITGEGKIDRQSLMGKITGKVLQAGQAQGIPVLAIAGCVEDREQLTRAGFQEVYSILPEGMSLEESMHPQTAIRNIRETISRIPLKNRAAPLGLHDL